MFSKHALWLGFISVFLLGCVSLIVGGHELRTHVLQPTQDPFDLRLFPRDLICDEIDQVGIGPTWLGITIGETSREDAISTITQYYEETDFSFEDGIVQFNRIVSELVPNLPNSVQMCFHDGTVATLRLSILDYDLLPRLAEIIDRFSFPDLITWSLSNPEVSRIAFWFEEGIAVNFSIIPDDGLGTITQVVYFSYQPSEVYESRWPYIATRLFYEDPLLLEDSFGVANPFDLEATGTAIAEQTPRPASTQYMPEVVTLTPSPTPTFTPRATTTASPSATPTP